MQNDNESTTESLLVQACHFIDGATGGVSPPIQLSSTFARDSDYEFIGDYSYSRSANPSWAVLEKVCTELDGGASRSAHIMLLSESSVFDKRLAIVLLIGSVLKISYQRLIRSCDC